MQNPTLQTGRILSIDAFRGITILVMIFVNELAGVQGIPMWMKHMPADADAMTFVDVVFPAFMFIVGMSIPFAISGRMAKGETTSIIQIHVLIRTAALLVFGVFMVNAEGGFDQEAMGFSIHVWSLLFYLCAVLTWNVYPKEKKTLAWILRAVGIIGLVILAFLYHGEDSRFITPQWWGILGLIGWAYLMSGLVYQLSQGKLLMLLITIALCLAYYLAGRVEGSSSFGILFSQGGHASHIAIVISGCVLSILLFETNTKSVPRKMQFASLFIIALTIAGWILHQFSPISKIYATPPWALFCAAICCVLFLLLYWIIEMKKVTSWTNFFKPAAANPLLTYIIPFILYHVMQLAHLSWPDIFYEGVYGILWSAIYALAVMTFVIVLNRLKIRLQL